MSNQGGYKKALARIRKAKENNLTEIDLSSLELTELPEELFQLINLKQLDVFSNQLTQLPEQIGNLVNLQTLNISFNKLIQLPEQIRNLANLQVLEVSSNELTHLPEAIRNLINLQELYIYTNRITQLSVQIENLINLQYLFVFSNQINQLPEQIGNLINLKVLDVSSNQITELPKQIGNLINLQSLDFSYNRISQLPVQIGNLVNLQSLYVSSNRIDQLPRQIGNLVNLQSLDVSSNHLTRLPLEIGNLANLHELQVSSNQLNQLPQGINNLNKLMSLFLHNNPAIKIPSDLLGPTEQELREKEIKPADPQRILEYYFRTRKEKRPINEAKLILVGRGEVGKTSLVNRLIDNKFNKSQRKTDGIKIRNWEVELKKNDKVRLNVWDFGGQEIMHATHQFFLTERSLYLLVLDGRGGLEDSDAEYWLKIISSFGANSPVIIVMNKIKSHSFDLNRKALQEKYPSIKSFVKTDCSENTGIRELLSEIKKQTNSLENLRAPFPAAWFEIKEEISRMRDNYLSFENFKEFCKEHGETDEAAHESLAYFLHQLGIALNFKEDERLKDTHVLNPHWLTEGIYKILNSDLLASQNGEISEKDLSRILNPKKYPVKMHRFLFNLMKKFDLCFQTPKKSDSYLIPELLAKEEPVATKDFKPEECINFQYNYTVLPNGLLPRFIVRTYTISEGQKRWRTGVILQRSGCRALVKADITEKKVFIHINGELKKRLELISLIRSDFERIHADIKNLNPVEMVPIPGHPGYSIEYKKLVELNNNRIEKCDEYIDKKIVSVDVKSLLVEVDLEKQEPTSAKVFISYSHKDEFFKNQLETHLKVLQRQNIISTWNDRKIIPGQDWKDQIDSNLENSRVIVLLVSADFLASDYCYETEMNRAIEKHDKGETVVIPVFIRSCRWQKAPFSKIQGLPNDAKPVKSFKDKDVAWTYVVEKIEQSLEIFKKDDSHIIYLKNSRK